MTTESYDEVLDFCWFLYSFRDQTICKGVCSWCTLLYECNGW